MIEFELGIFFCESLGHDLPPQPRAGQDICLVDGVDFERRVGGQSNLGCDPSDTLHLSDAVYHGVPGDIGLGLGILFFPLAKVCSTDELTDDNEAGALGNLGAEGRVLEEGVGGEVRRANIRVETKSLTEGEQARFRSHFGIDAPLRTTNCTYIELFLRSRGVRRGINTHP